MAFNPTWQKRQETGPKQSCFLKVHIRRENQKRLWGPDHSSDRLENCTVRGVIAAGYKQEDVDRFTSPHA